MPISPDVQGRVQTGPEGPPDASRVAIVLGAIPTLDAEKDWTKPTGQRPAMPRVDSLTAAVGFEVTREERDAAFAEYEAKGAGK